MARYFITSGAVTAVFPTAANIDTGVTTTNTTYASSFFKANDDVVLTGVMLLTRNTGASETMSFVDKAGNTIFQITGLNNAALGDKMFGAGIAMPAGGFGITTTSATTVYMFLFDYKASVA